MKKFFKEFKEFAMKGNIVDMAVGVVIGGAFGKIVTALVENIITPLISMLTGDINLSNLAVHLRDEVLNEAGEVVTEAVNLSYGAFIQSIIDFLIIALSIFIVLKLIMNASKKLEALKKKEEEEAPAEEAPAETELSVLKEIKEMLEKK